MDRIDVKIAALPRGSTYFSLEFFPPKTSMGTSNLRERIAHISRVLQPLFVTVTWGAGGSTANNSLELAKLCQRELGLTTCLHLTCTNMSRQVVDRALINARRLGIRNILALRGDPPRKEYADQDAAEKESLEFKWAVDLVQYIKGKYGDYFCIGVAAYPDGHTNGNNMDGQSLDRDLPYLVEKVKAGADFIMTQLFFDIGAYQAFEKRLREHESGCFKTLPIIPGLMPIQNYQMVMRTIKLTHVQMPPEIIAQLEAVRGDDEQVKNVGVDIISEMVKKIKSTLTPVSMPQGFHFYTLNLEKAVTFILQRTALIPQRINELGSHNTSTDQLKFQSSHTDATPAQSLAQNPIYPSADHHAMNSSQKIVEVTSDKFPKGRWGDPRSPAYGEIDRYGVSLHVSNIEAIRLWGYPTSIRDITTLFKRHIKGSLRFIPWDEEGLDKEANVINEQLLRLNKKGWWTIASQPAINSVPSVDPVFGWGAPNGFVFQKAFVEFFLPSPDWIGLQAKLCAPEVQEHISWYACNADGNFFSHIAGTTYDSAAKEKLGNTNAVTWGTFPDEEVLTPTIIDDVSFHTWAQEAFSIWFGWAKVYSGPGPNIDSKREISRKFLEGLSEDIWLVNIIHHDVAEKDGLWKLLLE
ncbi:Methylenetetrahydrofolate reductase 2 [Podosphaera aphanis]|nr:Methylenetetrahydrofolate reductase 2 [Podosphaera aphanis]